MCHSYLARHNLDFASVLARLSGLVIFTQPKAAVSQESLQIDITLSMQLRATKTKNSKTNSTGQHNKNYVSMCTGVHHILPLYQLAMYKLQSIKVAQMTIDQYGLCKEIEETWLNLPKMGPIAAKT